MGTNAIVPGSFPNGLVALRHAHGRTYEVEEEFSYVTRSGQLLTVPIGFLTDGGSVPRALWWLYPPFGSDCDEAYVLHDFAYAHPERWSMNRGQADALMREVLEVKGFRPTGRFAVWGGVRMFGWLAWRKHRRECHE